MESEKAHESTGTGKIVFGIVGGGWRSEFFLRIAKELPQRFEVCGVVTRSESKGLEIENRWKVKTCRTVDELLRHTSPSFVVVSVLRDAAPGFIKELSSKGVPVLAETPPAPDLEGLLELNKLTRPGARIQVAEQYHLQPMNAACIAIANSGKLGEINQVQLSLCHGYHAVSMFRKLLGIKFENAVISASTYTMPIVAGPTRFGLPEKETVKESSQTIAFFRFGDKLAVYDFSSDQYFSWIRSKRLLVLGERGEIYDSGVKYLKDFLTPVEYELKRMDAGEYGNHEGYYLKGLLGGEEWLYKNPYIPGKLSDDEIAVAACIEKMALYVKGGPEFYSLAEASQDHYLAMTMIEAARTGTSIATRTQPWAYTEL